VWRKRKNAKGVNVQILKNSLKSNKKRGSLRSSAILKNNVLIINNKSYQSEDDD
jgi:hypothetical protein